MALMADGITSSRDGDLVALSGIVGDAQAKIGEIIHMLPIDQRPAKWLQVIDRDVTGEWTAVSISTHGQVRLDATPRDLVPLSWVRFFVH